MSLAKINMWVNLLRTNADGGPDFLDNLLIQYFICKSHTTDGPELEVSLSTIQRGREA